MTLDLADYTESMSALHHILTETPISQQLPYVLPPFTEKQLKEGLRTSWTAEQIGRLAVKYESEWYADKSLSKWNEIDDFYEKERQAKQAAIQKELEDKKNSKPAAVEYAQEALTAIFKFHINEWNIEKNQRIKPSLWWNEVVTAQQAQTESTTAPVLSKLPTDGKIWHLHPVGMKEFNIPFGITVEMLKQIFTNAKNTTLQAIVDDINKNYELYQLNTELRLTHFFAQALQEVGTKCTTKAEVLNYTSDALKVKFKYFRKNPKEAILYGRVETGNAPHSADQVAIANRVYANRIGNGDIASGDGWKYRGRGIFQLTGKDNYKGLENWYYETYNVKVQFIDNPDLVNSLEYMTVSATYFWLKHKLYKEADKGYNHTNIDNITKIINLNTDSYEARQNNFKKIIDSNIFSYIFS